MPKKSQEESEQPAKVYQLDALAEQVAVLSENMKDGFKTTNSNISALLIKTDSQITPQQLSDNIITLDKKFDARVNEEVEKIHLEYRPVKNAATKLIWAVIGQGIIVVGNVVLFFILRGES